MIYRDQKEAGGWKLSITSLLRHIIEQGHFCFFKDPCDLCNLLLNAGTNSKIGENICCRRILLVSLNFWNKIFGEQYNRIAMGVFCRDANRK